MVTIDERQGVEDRRQKEGPGQELVGRSGILGISASLGLLAAFLMYMLVAIWPTPVPNLGSTSGADSVARRALASSYWSCDSVGMTARWRADSTVRDPKCVAIAGVDFRMWRW